MHAAAGALRFAQHTSHTYHRVLSHADAVLCCTAVLHSCRRTLAAVHSGADLSAAIDGVLGYDAGECKGEWSVLGCVCCCWFGTSLLAKSALSCPAVCCGGAERAGYCASVFLGAFPAGKRVKVEPLTAVATPQLRQLLSALLMLVQSSSGAAADGSGSSKVSAMLEMDKCLKTQALVVQARHCLAPALREGNRVCQGRCVVSDRAAGVCGSVVGAAGVTLCFEDLFACTAGFMFAGFVAGLCAPCRLRDVLFLDLALELAGRGALEAGLSAVRAAAPSTLLGGLLALLQQPLASACMSALPGQGSSAALVSVAGQLSMLSQDCPGESSLVVL